MTQPQPSQKMTPPPETVNNAAHVINLKRSERAFFGGRTGSGKSTLADKLIRQTGYRTAVIDPKHGWDFPGYLPVDRYDPSPDIRRQVFRPNDTAADGWADTVRFMNAAWNDRQPVLIYVDELSLVTTPRIAPPIMLKFARQGRSHNKGLWTGTQRPVDIPGSFLTEAEHWFIFDLRNASDRKKVAGFLGDAVSDRPKGRYSFWYGSPEFPDAVLIRQPGDKPK